MISCTQCKTPLTSQAINTYGMVPCPSCSGLLRADVYPALYRKAPAGQVGETLQMDQEAGCFYHPRKKAVIPCAACGRFLCSLCDVEFNGRHLCPICLEKGKTKRKITNLENHRVCYDRIALLIAIVPMLIVYITILTAPIVIFMTFRYWNAPGSIIPHTKIRFILAFVIAVLQLAGWFILFSNLVGS